MAYLYWQQITAIFVAAGIIFFHNYSTVTTTSTE